MKKTATILFVLLFCASTSMYAQDSTIFGIDSTPVWVPMNDSVGSVLGITADQQHEWNARNERWDSKYEALGKEPEKSPNYIKLHSAREFDLRGFLTGGQYDKWKVLNKRSRRISDANPPGTNVRSDR